jgi:FkbM family methyltransferase
MPIDGPDPPDLPLPRYDAVILCRDVRVPVVPGVITPIIERQIRSGRYEGGEVAKTLEILQPGDRILELGGGIGYCAASLAADPRVDGLCCVEADPQLFPIIRETLRLNGVDGVHLRWGAVTGEAGGSLPFHVRRSFWASSLKAGPLPWTSRIMVPRLSLSRLIADVRPTVVLCDVEGGELDLFAGANLAGVRAVILELHPRVYGEEGTAQVLHALRQAGLSRVVPPRRSSVQLFLRDPEAGMQPALPRTPGGTRGQRARPRGATGPRILVATCMRDEGPYVLEWLAWHKAIGVTDFVVFTNDCTDGTDALLDRLDAAGEVMHLPNPAVLTDMPMQHMALRYAPMTRPFREADYFISMDVDEFINIRCGRGRLADLFAAAGSFDALSISELNHGTNGRDRFEPGWVIDCHARHQSERPGKWKARRGVKTLVRLGHWPVRLRNHRPDFLTRGPVRWLDGSLRETAVFRDDPMTNGHDCRGTYGAVVLNHYALRSVDGFLVKVARGDVIRPDKSPSRHYFRSRNRHHSAVLQPGLARPLAEIEHARLLALPGVAAAHAACVERYRDRIAEIAAWPQSRDWRNWIRENVPPEAVPADAPCGGEPSGLSQDAPAAAAVPAPASAPAPGDVAAGDRVRPRLLVATCMRDEGPFVLEWLAWHKATGIDAFVIYSNDCTDGTDDLLDLLDAAGELTHLPNPFVLTGESLQPAALEYTQMLRQFRETDYFISMDADEFINIRIGRGHIDDLFAAAGPFDALSVTEVNHGTNRLETFQPGWQIDLFPRHQVERPGKWKARRGVKTILRPGDRIARIGNHRPHFVEGLDPPPRWLDGSLRETDFFLQDKRARGHDCRTTYDAVVLNHFSVRSVESFLVKLWRGDAIRPEKSRPHRYFRRRNRNDQDMLRPILARPAADAEHARLMAIPGVAAAHDRCIARHRARIAELTARPDYREWQAWIRENAWN